MFHRAPGSIGASSDPSRVWPGHKLPGRMGGDRRTVLNLSVVRVLPEQNLVLIRGAVPGANGSLGIRECLIGVAGADQNRSVISKDGRAIGLETKSALEILAGADDVAMLEFELAGNEVGGRAQLWATFRFEAGKSILVDFPAAHDSSGQIALIGQAVCGNEGGKIGELGGC